MPLTLSLKTESLIPLEVDSVRLETVRRQSIDEVKSTLIQRGNEKVPLSDHFNVAGSAKDDNMLVWEGDCSRVKWIGAYLDSGTVRVTGSAGMHLGAEMTGGTVEVSGDSSDWVGAEMKGGRITVHGNAGHLVGAAYRGGRHGMTGGEIFIKGNAGNEIGHTMRRGLIAIGGVSGDAVGFNMIAGTICLFGDSGIRPGAGMRRGTIAFLGKTCQPEMLPTFQLAHCCQPLFLKIYLRHLRSAGFHIHEIDENTSFHRYRGDFLEFGKGEILVRNA